MTEGDGFGGNRNGAGVCQHANFMTAFRYPASAHARDAHAAYASAALPWVFAVHRFLTPNRWPKQFDHAPMEIPAGSPPGAYIVHYKWRGYYDCIDVDVLPPSSPLPMTSRAMYGMNGETIFMRTDHCQYDRRDFRVFQGNTNDCNRARPTCHYIAPPGQRNAFGQSPEAALRRCMLFCADRPTTQCRALMVVPRDLPPGVAEFNLSGTGGQNIPWGVKNCRPGCADQHHPGAAP